MNLKLTDNVLWHSEPGASGGGAPAPAPSGGKEDSGDIPAGPETTDFAALSLEMEADASDDSSPVPSAGPATASTPTPPATPAQQQVPGVPPTAAPAAPVPPVPAAAAPPAAPPAPATAPATPAAPAAAAPSAAPAVEQQPLTPEKIAEAYQAYEKNILPQLEKQYVLSPEQAREIEENPAAAIPKLMARVHYQAHVAAFTGIMSQLPQIVQMVMEKGNEVTKAEEKFFGRWPLLKDSKHKQVVDNVLRSYRAANPSVTTEDMIEKAGLIAMISLGLDPTPQTAGTPPGSPPPAGGFPPSRPAGVGSQGAPRSDRGAVDIWSQMADEIIADGS